jgi:hypothetical protein
MVWTYHFGSLAFLDLFQTILMDFYEHTLLQANQYPSVRPLLDNYCIGSLHQASGNLYPLTGGNLKAHRVAVAASNPRVGFIRRCH